MKKEFLIPETAFICYGIYNAVLTGSPLNQFSAEDYDDVQIGNW